jgi:hypothetical protein
MEEIWKPIGKLVRFDSNYNIVKTFDYKGTCFVSNNGRVRLPNGNISKTKPDKLGYTTIKLGNERFKVQQIMMQTFHPEGIRNGVSVDHIDRNPRNNNLQNLRWADTKLQTSNRENKLYKYKKVICVENGVVYYSCQEAEDSLGLVRNTVSRVARGERKSIHGYHFYYVGCERDKEYFVKACKRIAAETSQASLF